MPKEEFPSLADRPYEVFSAGGRWGVQQRDESDRLTIWVGSVYFSTEEEARAHCADLEHLRTQIPGQLSLFDTHLNPTPEAQGFDTEEASK